MVTNGDSKLPTANNSDQSASVLVRVLNRIEKWGNKLPDPAVLFLIGMVATWILSGFLSRVTFAELDPRTQQSLEVENLLSLKYFAKFLSAMVKEFVEFPPLGVVLVALLGVGVAEHSGFINACLKNLLKLTPTSC